VGAKLSSRTAVLREQGIHVLAASLECMPASRFSRRTQSPDLFAWMFIFTATSSPWHDISVYGTNIATHESWAYYKFHRDKQMIHGNRFTWFR
jgi:hypothetical protein